MSLLVDIILPLAIQDTYTYRVPDSWPCPSIGTRVLVPLSRKEVVGIVLQEHTGPLRDGVQVRDIIQVLDPMAILSEEQIRLWHWIADYYMCPIGDVMAAALPAKALDRQYTMADSSKRRVQLDRYKDTTEPEKALTAAQQVAKDSILLQWKNKTAVLLEGVTSSGKTEIYIHLIREQLLQGKQVLYLVPEIALTTQLTNRLQRVFGNLLRVYHSRITDAHRMEIYRQQRLDVSPRLIVGARSAIFLPFTQLGLIIVDEEHEGSYKQQDPAPRYHVRSVALVMAHQVGAKVLLGTATPAVESRYNAEQKKYGYVRLTERYQGLQLPQITLIDLQRQYKRKEMYEHFSDPLVDKMRAELSQGKQIILFQNRRGYAPYIQCTACGAIPQCTDCAIRMTLHMRERLLACHYCGHTVSIPSTCPQCGGKLQIHGFGTERLEDEVHRLFPEARVARMDWDTTRKKNDYEDIITAFSNHDVDILIGTQMVTKGLHFDDVSLVAVLQADQLLSQPDYRSNERAYHMLEQVSGRAGRTGKQGEVMIQTFDPHNPIFDYLQAHDTEAMYQHELAEREMFHFPPFYRQIYLILRHSNEQRVDVAARLLQERLKKAFGQRVTDVVTPHVAKIQKQYIRQINLRIEVTANIQEAKHILRSQMEYVTHLDACKGIQIVPDVDPM